MTEYLLEEKVKPITGVTKFDPGIPISEGLWQRIKVETTNINLSITNKCNQACRVCFISDEEGNFSFDELSKEDIQFILSKIGKHKKVYLSGGEPTLRDDLFEIVKMVKDSDNIPMLYTNGIKLADASYVHRLAYSGIKKIYLSIGGLTESTSGYLTGDPYGVYSKLQALENLGKYSNLLKVCLSPTILRGINEDEIPRLLDLAISKNDLIKGVVFVVATPGGCYRLPLNTTMAPSDVKLGLEEATKGVLSKEYFLEFGRLRKNLNYYLLGKFGRRVSLFKNCVYVKIDRHRLKQFIPLKLLKEINQDIEDKKYAKLVKYAFQYRDWLGLFKKSLNPATVEFETNNRKGLIISVDKPCRISEELSKQIAEAVGIIEWEGQLFVVGVVT